MTMGGVPPRGGWTGAGEAKPAADYDIRSGSGLLWKASAGWPGYVVVTTPSAYRAANDHLARPPDGVVYARWLDWGHLDELANCLPDSDLVVGLGGGVALDAAKFVALKKGCPIVVVPTATSTGAIIHGFFARWEGRKIIGSVGEWPWIDFADIIVDYDIVLKAPVHLNTAGLGDVLCGYSGIAEWRRNAASGCGPAFDEEAAAPALANFDGIVAGFPATLTEGGDLTPASIDLIVTAIQERDDLTLRHPAAPMADHPFAIAIEEANDTGWVHGELVALGAQCVVWLCEGESSVFPSWLDACMVRRRPTEIGLTAAQLLRGLSAVAAVLSREASPGATASVLATDHLRGPAFDDLWSYLHA